MALRMAISVALRSPWLPIITQYIHEMGRIDALRHVRVRVRVRVRVGVRVWVRVWLGLGLELGLGLG